jgi:CheY-like chemotaxis protein
MAHSDKDLILAEDDMEDVQFFKSALQEIAIPYIMRHAENGELLFILLKERIPDLLFLDIHMPCKDGLSCIKEIRQHKEYDALPVIMYTSDERETTIENCYRNGANFYLLKPNKFTSLTENLRKIFSLDWKTLMHYPPMGHFVLR